MLLLLYVTNAAFIAIEKKHCIGRNWMPHHVHAKVELSHM
jgi:hypothetical protein